MNWIKLSDRIPEILYKNYYCKAIDGSKKSIYITPSTFEDSLYVNNNIVEWLDEKDNSLRLEIQDTNLKLFNLIEKLYNIEQSKLDKITDSDRLNWLEQTYADNERLHEVPLNNLTLREFIDLKIK